MNINGLLRSEPCGTLRSLFPELTAAQFRCGALYSMGVNNHDSAGILGITEAAVKKHLAHCRDALGEKELSAIRALFICRSLLGLYTASSEPMASKLSRGK